MVQMLYPMVQQVIELQGEDELNTIMCEYLGRASLVAINTNLVLKEGLRDVVYELEANKVKHNIFTSKLPTAHAKLLLFVVQALKLELKPLSSHLKYAYLGEENTPSVVVTNKLEYTVLPKDDWT